MTRIAWDVSGQRVYEAGIDRGVLYVGFSGVPWNGLVSVDHSQVGGQSKPRYIDGVKVSNGQTPEDFEATLRAITYPLEFEQCDGTKQIAYGFRATQQRRKPFSLAYRSMVGSDTEELGVGYKIHLLYNLRAEPSSRSYQTLSDEPTPMDFTWKLTSRPEIIEGLTPAAHYVIDSRDVPSDLLQTVEDILYGSDSENPRLPSAAELAFIFDSFLDLVYDAGHPLTPVFATYDAGGPTTPYTNTIDGGAP